MRPIRLVVEGFTCFKDKQPPLDFSSLELFAISGPTGSGKTSLLDALIFALYGRVPRVGKAYGELISLGRDRMSVLLDFDVGRRSFRVTRAGRRGRSGEAQLEEISGEEEIPLASGINNVDAAIVDLLGLRYDAFTQAVVLPQGEFARFLRSQPRERREILRDLLRLQIYERMRREAFERARELDVQLHNIKERLEQDYQAATPESLEKLRSEGGRRDEALERMSSNLEGKRGELDLLKVLHDKSGKLEEGRERLERLNQRIGYVDEAAGRLDAARRAAPLAPLFEAADTALKRAQEDEERAALASEWWGEIRMRRDEAAERTQRARRSAEEIPHLRQRIRALDEVKGLMAPRESTKKRLRESMDKSLALEREVAEVKEARIELVRDVEGLQEELQAASEDLEGIGYDPELDRKLDEVRNEAVRLHDLRRAARRDEESAHRGGEKLESLKSENAEIETALREVRQELEEAIHRTGRAEEALREAEQDHSAAHLRQHLQVGKKCPVCDRMVKKLPPPVQMTFLEALRSRLDEVKKAEAESRRVTDEKNRQAARVKADLDAACREARELRERAEASKQAARDLEQGLVSALGPAVDDEGGDTVETRVLAAAKRSSELRTRFELATKRKQEIEKEQVRSRSGLDNLERRIDTLLKQKQELEEQIEKDEKELGEIDARVAKVTDAKDPNVEAESLAEQIHEIETALKNAEESEHKLAAEAASAKKAAEESIRTAEMSRTQAQAGRERLSAAVLNAGFGDEEAARRAAVEPEEQARLEREVTDFRQEHHALEKQVAELESELGGRLVSAEELVSAEAVWAEKKNEYETCLRERAALGQQIKELEEKVAKAAELSQRHEVIAREHVVYRRLADDLRSEHFQAYLLEEAFRDLVGGASERLKKLSERYALEYRDDGFVVLDHDNAGERRSADTLSGGETFLASLALALELSEQVQRAAGAVNLDSLFIDEGFGTLDPETLDTVAAAIETLPVAGRMVGIITHIPELTERLPACIRVEKTPEGSRIVR